MLLRLWFRKPSTPNHHRCIKSVLKRYSTVSEHAFKSLGNVQENVAPLAPVAPVESVPRPKKGKSIYESIKQHMLDHPNSVVLTQMGSFFELYFEQAVEYGPQMNLKIAKKGTNEEACGYVHMAGFPVYQLDRYLKILVNDLKKSVALVEQYELPDKQDGRQFERKVSRIVTPGTLVSESFIDSQHSNFLLSIVFTNLHLEKKAAEDSPVGLSWLDLSLGELFYQSSTVKELASDIARLQPKEIVLDSAIKKYAVEEGSWHQDLVELKRYHLTYYRFPGKEAFDIYSPFKDTKIEQYKVDNAGHREMGAVTAILAYVKENLPECEVQIKPPQEQDSRDIVKMDARSIEALELFNSTTDSARGSLMSTIKRTVSPSGTRMLSSWLSTPLLDIGEIRKRQDLVDFFLYHGDLRRNLIERFRYLDDVVRLMQRLSSLRRTDPADLVAVGNAIQLMSGIRDLLINEKESCTIELIETLNERLTSPLRLAKKIDRCIDSDAVIESEENSSPETDPGDLENHKGLENTTSRTKRRKPQDGMVNSRIMKENATQALARLYEEYRSFDSTRRDLWQSLMSDQPPGVQVSLRWSPMYLYHVHVTLSRKHSTFDDVRVPGLILNQTKNKQSVQYEPWTQLGTSRENMNERKREMEEKLLKKLRKEALACLDDIRACCEVVDKLDVVTSFATLAKEHNLVRPKLKREAESHIVQGRHITVETGLKLRGNDFTSNDCHLSQDKIWVITGPNMGGKSTFIRQTALMSILAQIGCFVPASEASLGVVDQIFCRVGAADDLYRDRSTFMVEMLETSSILRNATPNSLAILDEVGRGTSSRDGLAIAYATIVHLSTINKCRALFATHFGPELHQLLENHGYNKSAVEYHHATWQDGYFHYRLKPGISDNSHGLRIAEMAGFPKEAMKIAESVYSEKG